MRTLPLAEMGGDRGEKPLRSDCVRIGALGLGRKGKGSIEEKYREVLRRKDMELQGGISPLRRGLKGVR